MYDSTYHSCSRSFQYTFPRLLQKLQPFLQTILSSHCSSLFICSPDGFYSNSLDFFSPLPSLPFVKFALFTVVSSARRSFVPCQSSASQSTALFVTLNLKHKCFQSQLTALFSSVRHMLSSKCLQSHHAYG